MSSEVDNITVVKGDASLLQQLGTRVRGELIDGTFQFRTGSRNVPSVMLNRKLALEFPALSFRSLAFSAEGEFIAIHTFEDGKFRFHSQKIDLDTIKPVSVDGPWVVPKLSSIFPANWWNDFTPPEAVS